MSRALVYPEKVTRSHGSGRGRGRNRPRKDPRQTETDSYREKLVKYVPAEATAFFVTAAAALSDEETAKGYWVIALLLGLVITVLFVGGTISTETPLPPLYAYVLAGIAFLAWSFGTTSVGSHVFEEGWSSAAADIILSASIFVVPGIDQFITRLKMQRR